MARWQLATGTTLLEGWTRHLGKWIQYAFIIYLIPWSFVVGGALMSACGLAAHAIAPALSVRAWGAINSVVAATLVLLGGYPSFERLMKIFIGVMFLGLIGCALAVAPPAETIAAGFSEASVPPGGVGFALGVIGGVGGSVTLLSYGYWIREKGWEGRGWKKIVRVDLGIAYVLTGLFGIAVIVLAARVLHPGGVIVEGPKSVVAMAEMLGSFLGAPGAWAFRIGFWAAVSTSILGVWHGVPYIFCDFVGLVRKPPREEARRPVEARSPWYRGFLLYLALPPMVLLFMDEPVAVIVLYAAVGALFMPFIAGTLLYMNSRSSLVGAESRNGWLTNALLALCLLLFGYLGWIQLARSFGAG
jgi:Mn2+/Fe2+ NRAMP family transporter